MHSVCGVLITDRAPCAYRCYVLIYIIYAAMSRQAFSMAYLGGWDLWEPTTCAACFAVMTGEDPPDPPPPVDIMDVASGYHQHSTSAEKKLEGDGLAGGAELAGASVGRVATRVAQTVWQEQLRRQLLLATNRGLGQKAAEEVAEAAARRAAQVHACH